MSTTSTSVTNTPIRQFNQRRRSARRSILVPSYCDSNLFPTKTLPFQSGKPEIVVLGGRQQFPLIPKAFDRAGIKQILFIGWGSQSPAQTQNLRDTLQSVGRSDIKVCVGLRPNSQSITKAKEAGFTSENGTLGDILPLANQSDLVVCLIADGGMVKTHKEIFRALKPGAIVGISHGFIVGHLESINEELPPDHDFIMVAPKGMGASVRKLYLQGADKDGAGINSSVAVRASSANRLDNVREVANAWSVGIGSPVTFGTDFISEVTSDLFGERAMLLGGLWGFSEAMFEFYASKAESFGTIDSFRIAMSGITGTVTDLLSLYGIKGFYELLDREERKYFGDGYVIGYPVFDKVMDDIYQEVSSLQEIKTVIEATDRLSKNPMESIEENLPVWKLARKEKLYGERPGVTKHIAFAAGVYVGGIMAQLHTLLHHGHCVSEVVNESFIEAVDSLTPYMDARGVAFMVDNCSTTARLGTRLWGPIFRGKLLQALRGPTVSPAIASCIMQTFFDEPLHHDVKVCMAHRPSVRIAVPLQS